MTIATTQKQKEALKVKKAAPKTKPASKATAKTVKSVKKATPVKTPAKKTKVSAASIASVEALLEQVQTILDNGKAQDILTINLTGKTSLADYLVIASGTSSRQVMALATTIAEKIKESGRAVKMEGKQGSGDWMILDLGDIIVHIFHPETRSFYEIEEIWGVKTPGQK